MKKATVQIIRKNFRYRIISIDYNFYLIDLDRAFLGYIFPFLTFILPLSGVKISEDLVNKLALSRNNNIKYKPHTLLAGSLTLLLTYFLNSIINKFNSDVSIYFKLAILFFLMFLSILFRLYISIRNKNSILNIIDMSSQEKIKLRLLPNIPVILKISGAYLFFVWICFLGAYAYINSGNIIILLMYIFLFTLILFSNVFSIFYGDYKGELILC